MLRIYLSRYAVVVCNLEIWNIHIMKINGFQRIKENILSVCILSVLFIFFPFNSFFIVVNIVKKLYINWIC